MQLKTDSQQCLDDLYEDYGETYYNGSDERWYRLEGVSALEIDVLEKETDGNYSDGFTLYEIEWVESEDRSDDFSDVCIVRLMRDC